MSRSPWLLQTGSPGHPESEGHPSHSRAGAPAGCGTCAFESAALSLPLAFIWWRTRCFRLVKAFPVHGAPPVRLVRWQAATGRLNRIAHETQQALHPLCPGLLILLPGTLKFPQMMGIAQGVLALIAVIRFPVIMAEHALETRQDPTSSIACWPRFSWGANQVRWSFEAQCSQ